jgi:hypothetical protein
MLTARIFFLLSFAQHAFAQGYGSPLTMQGLNQLTLPSASSRAAGGIVVGMRNDVSLMFSNPASLQTLADLRVSVGGLQRYTDAKQSQAWFPLRYLPNFSLLMGGLTDLIPNPVDTILLTRPRDARDTVQRPHDNITPNWSRSKQYSLPLQAVVGIPFSIGTHSFAVGVGAVEYANLEYYFQNNNVLNPSVGTQRPYGFPAPDKDTIVQWSQSYQSRHGSIYGYGGALSMAVSEKFSFGVSGLVLMGSTDDKEQVVGRGKLTVFNQGGAYFFRNDSVAYHLNKAGTSDYSGLEFTMSGIYSGKYINLGFSVKPPTTITRKYQTGVQADSMGVVAAKTSINSKDKMTLPWRGTIGMSISIRPDLMLGLEYDFCPYSVAVYKDPNGKETNPWRTASVFHVGTVYVPLPWLALRAGYRQQSEVFEPEGNPLVGNPVSYSIYSTGCGLAFGRLQLNLAYEYSFMKYQDRWQTNVNLNRTTYQNVVADLSYEIPWWKN